MLRECFEDFAEGIREWGEIVAHRYIRRVNQITAASGRPELRAIRSLRLHPLKGGRSGQWSMVLHGRWRLIVTFAEDTVTVEEVSNHYDD
jgi:proteic killer suppression protein